MSQLDEPLSLLLEPPVATLCLRRVEKRNALTIEMWSRLAELVGEFDDDNDLQVLLIRSTDPAAFCAGADLDEIRLTRRDGAGFAVFGAALEQSLAAVRRCSKPTVACVRGACVGGGVELVLACDFAVADDSASFMLSPTGLGIVYPYPSTRRLVDSIGAASARFMLMTGRALSAHEALRLGLVSEILDADQFVAATEQLAREIGRRSRSAIAATKEIISMIQQRDPEAEPKAFEIEQRAIHSADYAEGLEAFYARRAPKFTDR